MIQTTQKDSFFKIIDSLMKYTWGMETGHFDSKSFWYKLKQGNFAKSLIASKKSLHLNKKNILGFSFFKSSM